MRQIDRTYDVAQMRDTLREALTTQEPGPEDHRRLVRMHAEQAAPRAAAVRTRRSSAGERVVRERFGVDEDVCTGDHACIRLSGCPSLSVKHTDDPLKDDPVAAIDETCVGCGNCGEVAEAAVLCPSFYRAEIVHNPDRLGPLHRAAARARSSAGCSAAASAGRIASLSDAA